MAVSTNQEVLVETEWVEANLARTGTRLLEVDEDTDAYGRGHIPGALGVHWKNDLQDPVRRDFIGPDGSGRAAAFARRCEAARRC